MSFTDFLFDTSQAYIDREVDNYDPRTGKRKKDLGDILGDLFTGQGSVIDQGVKDTYKNNLKRDYGIAISRLKKELPGCSISISAPAIALQGLKKQGFILDPGGIRAMGLRLR